MRIDIKGTNMELTEAIKAYVTEKVSALDKYFDNIQQVDVEIGKTSNHHQKGDIYFCEINMSVPRTLLRYRNEMDDLYKAITAAKKGMQEEIQSYKEKLRD
jgi:putative sigma-54 modulation protein